MIGQTTQKTSSQVEGRAWDETSFFQDLEQRCGPKQASVAVWSNGYVEIQFQYLKSRGSLDDSQRLALLQKLNQIPGIAIPEDALNRRPNITLSVLTQPDVMDKFQEVVAWAIAQIQVVDVTGSKSQ